MAQNINDLLSRLQAATSAQLSALGQQYETAQTSWLLQVDETCSGRHTDDPVAFQNCRLGALPRRQDRLALSLERAAEDFGAPIEYSVPIPDAVEILIPLPFQLPFGSEARLPLLIPIHPD